MKARLIEEATRIIGTFPLDPYPTNYAGKVASALVTDQGNIYTGISLNLACNVGSCAEQGAVLEMLKRRETKIAMIVSIYEGGRIIVPCGRCREMIAQIDRRNHHTLVLVDAEKTLSLSELLPCQWYF